MAEFRLPDLGEGVTEGEVVEWRVREGDTVERDQILGVVGTDKATVEVPSPFAGRVQAVLVAEGSRVHVGDPLLRVEGPDGALTTPDAAQAKQPAAPGPAPLARSGAMSIRRVPALPSVRRQARQRGIALEEVQGTGEGGRVRLPDLLAQGRRVPLRGPARAMAEQVTRAHRQVPQVTVVIEADMSQLERKLALGSHGEGRPTLLGLICLATLAELATTPLFNTSLDYEALELVYHDRVQLGIAVQAEDGLRVATVRDADLLAAPAFYSELQRVVSAARAGTLSAAELTGSTFTISSGGKQGGLLATPLVNWPNVAVLGVHAIEERAVVQKGQVVVGRRANLSLSFDHRVIDGMTASRFLYQLAARLASEA
ncbi:MAG: dihydrolipoamide acetyltransferase family protein [Candidatus Dormiibacterota bacterium]